MLPAITALDELFVSSDLVIQGSAFKVQIRGGILVRVSKRPREISVRKPRNLFVSKMNIVVVVACTATVLNISGVGASTRNSIAPQDVYKRQVYDRPSGQSVERPRSP